MKSEKVILELTEKEMRVVKAVAKEFRLSIKDAARKLLMGHVGKKDAPKGSHFFTSRCLNTNLVISM